jgi:hypothetical protein
MLIRNSLMGLEGLEGLEGRERTGRRKNAIAPHTR